MFLPLEVQKNKLKQNIMKSHFRFTKGQRSGIFVDISEDLPEAETPELAVFQKELDSLRIVKLTNSLPVIFPFNPNYITDYKGYTLGMTNEEIDRLHKFRARNKFVNSVNEFQSVTKISDSLLAIISPYFKFPEWVTNRNRNQSTFYSNNQSKSFDQKIDLNIATAKQLQRVNGIGEKLSDRIVKFRNKFPGGFIADVQLEDVYGLSPEVIQRVKDQFTVKTPRQIIKIQLNKATVEQLVTIQHIDYQLAAEIIDQRTLREGYNMIEELTKVTGFPADKIEIIKLYLKLD
jgi:DNA uptake protein ComE-like DNA-binding protein